MTKERYTEIYAVRIQWQDKNYYIAVEDIEELYFIEDIFSYSMVGKIQFNDRNGIMEFGPVTGNEKIGISYGGERSTEKELKFDIFKMSKMIPSQTSLKSGTDNYIEIVFVDEMFYNLTQSQYSTSWKDTKYSKIIQDISEYALEIDSFEKFEESIEKAQFFYIPFWSPKQTIDWITKRISGIKSSNPGFLFYNNTKGSNFITLESLLKQNELMKISNNEGIYKTTSENIADINRILGYRLSGIDNHSKKELKGGIGFGYDFNRKKFLSYDHTYNKGINNFTLLGRKSLFPDISNKNTNIVFTGENTQKKIENIYNNEWIKRYAMQQTLTIMVEGHEERYAGGLIEIKWPSKDDEEEFNKNLGGNYLVKSITHQFVNGSPPFRQKMILIKNAYESSDNTELLNSKNKNLGK